MLCVCMHSTNTHNHTYLPTLRCIPQTPPVNDHPSACTAIQHWPLFCATLPLLPPFQFCSTCLGVHSRIPCAPLLPAALRPLPRQLTYKEALAAVFIEGWIVVLIAVSGLRAKIVQAVPKSIMLSTAGGIGLFLAFIGMQVGAHAHDARGARARPPACLRLLS
jgi:hypothetical protein